MATPTAASATSIPSPRCTKSHFVPIHLLTFLLACRQKVLSRRVFDEKVRTCFVLVQFDFDKSQVVFRAKQETFTSLQTGAKRAFEGSYGDVANSTICPVFVPSRSRWEGRGRNRTLVKRKVPGFFYRQALNDRSTLIIAALDKSDLGNYQPSIAAMDVNDFVLEIDDIALSQHCLPLNVGRKRQVMKWLTELLDMKLEWVIDDDLELMFRHLAVGHVEQDLPMRDALIYTQKHFHEVSNLPETEFKLGGVIAIDEVLLYLHQKVPEFLALRQEDLLKENSSLNSKHDILGYLTGMRNFYTKRAQLFRDDLMRFKGKHQVIDDTITTLDKALRDRFAAVTQFSLSESVAKSKFRVFDVERKRIDTKCPLWTYGTDRSRYVVVLNNTEALQASGAQYMSRLEFFYPEVVIEQLSRRKLVATKKKPKTALSDEEGEEDKEEEEEDDEEEEKKPPSTNLPLLKDGGKTVISVVAELFPTRDFSLRKDLVLNGRMRRNLIVEANAAGSKSRKTDKGRDHPRHKAIKEFLVKLGYRHEDARLCQDIWGNGKLGYRVYRVEFVKQKLPSVCDGHADVRPPSSLELSSPPPARLRRLSGRSQRRL